MRFFKASLRTLIMLASTFSFLGGWILLAHSLKPASSSSSYSSASVIVPGITATSFPTLAPLPGFDSQQTQSLQPVQQNPFTIIAQPQQQQVQVMPMFTTSGS